MEHSLSAESREKSFSVDILVAVELIVFAALLVYSNALSAPLVFDDFRAIVRNDTLHTPGNVMGWLVPPDDLPVGGRPVLNFSFVLNYALSGTRVWGYHAFNLAIHILAGLTLFGIARRTFLQPCLRARFGARSVELALAIALLWVVHPLQTEAVTYISERAESLMALFYLLTLYCFIRATEPRAPTLIWSCFCVAACVAGLCTKEVMVTAPLLVLLYDRTFVAGTFRAAWAQHRRLYFALIGTWVLLIFLMKHLPARGVGLALGASSWNYALTECRAVAHYLRLAVWPHPLIFDYGPGMVHHVGEVLPQALLLAVLLGVALVAAFRRPPLGFLGLSFFLLLAPSSSVVPIVHLPIAEHRMYLPLACLVALLVLALRTLPGKSFGWAVGALVLVWGLATWQRNGDYRTEIGLWADTVAKRPANARAHSDLGYSLLEVGRLPEAQAELQEALRLNATQGIPLEPTDAAIPHALLAVTLAQEGKTDGALAEFQAALQLNSTDPATHYNLAHFLANTGRTSDAIAQFQEALRLRPDFPEARTELAKLHPPASSL